MEILDVGVRLRRATLPQANSVSDTQTSRDTITVPTTSLPAVTTSDTPGQSLMFKTSLYKTNQYWHLPKCKK